MQKIVPFLWFENQAEEAVHFYTHVFKKTKVRQITHYDESGAKASGMPEGTVMTIAFSLEGQEFVALNGGSNFTFTEAVSFVVNCKTQKEIDYYWEKLTEGGEGGQCGWLKDKFGLSWQIVPQIMPGLLSDRDAQKSQRVMKALMQMKKITMEDLQKAFEGK